MAWQLKFVYLKTDHIPWSFCFTHEGLGFKFCHFLSEFTIHAINVAFLSLGHVCCMCCIQRKSVFKLQKGSDFLLLFFESLGLQSMWLLLIKPNEKLCIFLSEISEWRQWETKSKSIHLGACVCKSIHTNTKYPVYTRFFCYIIFRIVSTWAKENFVLFKVDI